MIINRERRNKWISFAMMSLGLAMIAVPFATNADMMDWGFASGLLGFVIMITAFLASRLYNSRAKVQDEINEGETVLIHWKYDYSTWEKELQEELESLGTMKIAGSILGAVFLLIGVAVFFTNPDEMALFLAIMASVGGIVFASALLSAFLRKKKLLEDNGEAIVTAHGLCYKSELYNWNDITSRLAGVGIKPGTPEQLTFVLDIFNTNRSTQIPGTETYVIDIPIPTGQLPAAQGVVEYFDKPLILEEEE